MASWTLVPCLVSLDEEFDELAPGRDHASDGSIGDQAHKERTSSHNIDDGPGQGSTPAEDADSRPEVHAIDVDADLRKAGWSMERAVDIIVGRHRAGTDDRLQNVIYNRRIWSRSWGWTEREYTGSNPHDKHGHFESRYGTEQENDTRPWGLLAADKPQEEDEMDIAEFFASVGRATAVPADPNITQADRANRDNWAAAVRFALGYNKPYDMTVLPAGALGRIAEAVTSEPGGGA